MTTRYPGGLIRKTPPTITPPVDGEGGSAPGVWTLEQASYYTKTGTWPKPIIQRQLWATGDGTFGALGQNNQVSYSSPVQVGSEAYWTNEISGGYYQFAAVRNDGTLWAWGYNDAGVLGLNDRISRSSPTQVGALTNWSKVSFGFDFVTAIRNDGTLWAWGQNNSGQLGLGDVINRSSPVQVGVGTTWSRTTCGFGMTSAIKTDGTLWTWGSNVYGQLGQNTNVLMSSPVQVGALTTWLDVVSHVYFMSATKTDGTLWTWGDNQFGQLGRNNISPAQVSSPVQIGALTNWSKTHGPGYSTLAIKIDGTLWSWGSNDFGQLAQNDRVNRSSPVQVGADTWTYAVGNPSWNGDTIMGVKTNGTLWSWGQDSWGAQGTNTVVARSSPVQVGALTTWLKPALAYPSSFIAKSP